jgi:LysM repeat protein
MKRLLIIALVATSATASAQTDTTLNYRVQKGDTLDILAAEFYADRNDAIFIMVENKMQHPRKLNPGERLRIPVTREIRTEKGDTFESLAQRYLGDAKRAPFLADFNHRSVEESLATGTELTIPFHVTHTAAATESLASISAAYFGNSKHADELARYNALDKTSLDKGESIEIPILTVHVRDAKLPPLDTESQARDKQRKEAIALAQTALPIARTAWLQGDFGRVKEALAQLADKSDFLDTDTAVEVDVLLGKAHVAFDDTPLAVAAFARVLARKPRYELSPNHDSPKVLEAWQKAVSQLSPQ